MRQGVSGKKTGKGAKILGFIGDFGFSDFKNPRFHRRFCPFRSRASFRTCGTKSNGAKPPFGRSVAGIEKSVPGVRSSIAGFVKTGRIDVCP